MESIEERTELLERAMNNSYAQGRRHIKELIQFKFNCMDQKELQEIIQKIYCKDGASGIALFFEKLLEELINEQS